MKNLAILKLTLVIVSFLNVSCSSPPEEEKTNDTEKSMENMVSLDETNVEIFAAATLDENGDLTVQVRFMSKDGATGQTLWVYSPEHSRYQKVLDFLGYPQIGEEVSKQHWPYELLPN